MSSSGETIECGRCGGEHFEVFHDSDPMGNSGSCLDCGYCYYTTETQMTLQEVNEERAECDMPPLEELKKSKGDQDVKEEDQKEA